MPFTNNGPNEKVISQNNAVSSPTDDSSFNTIKRKIKSTESINVFSCVGHLYSEKRKKLVECSQENYECKSFNKNSMQSGRSDEIKKSES